LADKEDNIMVENQNDAMVAAYDDEAEACGWFGPEVVFGLAYTYVQPGQLILDIGIGTRLGLEEYSSTRWAIKIERYRQTKLEWGLPVEPDFACGSNQ
jgi:hypothetical protein